MSKFSGFSSPYSITRIVNSSHHIVTTPTFYWCIRSIKTKEIHTTPYLGLIANLISATTCAFKAFHTTPYLVKQNLPINTSVTIRLNCWGARKNVNILMCVKWSILRIKSCRYFNCETNSIFTKVGRN